MGKDGKAYEDGLLTDWSAPPPNFVLKSILSVVGALRGLLTKLNPPPATVLTQCTSFIPAAWLMMTAKLGIADLLKDGPLTAAELATKTSVREDDLYRALRMLSMQGYYEALHGTNGQPTRFRNNAASATLREDHPNSVKHLAIHSYYDVYSTFGPQPVEWHLRQTGGDDLPCAFEHLHGMDYWQHARKHPAVGENFSKAMTNADALGLQAQLADYDWGRFSRVIDVGGANGSVLAALLERRPTLQGVLFDQPQVIEGAKQVWQEHAAWQAVSERLTFVGGDFFKPETLPPLRDGDLLFLRQILHDWTDEASIKILKALRTGIGSAKVTLAISELILDPEFSASPLHGVRFTVDLLMLAMTRGRERTTEQWRALLAAGGFRLEGVQQMRCPESMAQAVPV